MVTDCKAVLHLWTAIRARRRKARKQVLAGSCWQCLFEALEAKLDVHCSWMPSHRTAAEAAKLAIPEAWHRGNGGADE